MNDESSIPATPFEDRLSSNLRHATDIVAVAPDARRNVRDRVRRRRQRQLAGRSIGAVTALGLVAVGGVVIAREPEQESVVGSPGTMAPGSSVPPAAGPGAWPLATWVPPGFDFFPEDDRQILASAVSDNTYGFSPVTEGAGRQQVTRQVFRPQHAGQTAQGIIVRVDDRGIEDGTGQARVVQLGDGRSGLLVGEGRHWLVGFHRTDWASGPSTHGAGVRARFR